MKKIFVTAILLSAFLGAGFALRAADAELPVAFDKSADKSVQKEKKSKRTAHKEVVEAEIILPADLYKSLPQDSALRKGVLPNGMTYYVRHNSLPKGQADFYIVHHVGAVQEDSLQNGLAHFLEHMAFNGTENYEGREMIEWLQSIGLKFGRDINAYTAQEETVYNINNVPTQRQGVVDSALMILRDWSHYISLLPEEIDAERGVILEEKRSGLSASRRLFDKSMPLLYNHTKYSKHDVIGPEEILKTFTYDQIRNFYNSWYRPDLQAIIVVGDIDPDKVEAAIKERFSKIPVPENAPTKELIEIPDYAKTEAIALADKEMTSSLIRVYRPTDLKTVEINNTKEGMLASILSEVVSSALGERFDELIMSGEPMLGAFSGCSTRTRHDVVSVDAVSFPEGDYLRAFELLCTEVERIRRYGLTQGQIDRALANILKSAEVKYNSRNDVKNNAFVNDYVSNFLDNEPLLDAETEYEITKELVAMVTPKMVNKFIAQAYPDNAVAIIAFTPDKPEAIIDPSALVETYERVAKSDIEPIADDDADKQLINTPFSDGSIVSRSTDSLGYTVLTLSNGIRVHYRPTDVEQDIVLMRAIDRNAGYSILPVNLLPEAKLLGNVVNNAGLGEHTAVELSRLLSGNSANVTPQVGETSAQVIGSAAYSDLKTLFELAWLTFNEPRFDSESFDVTISQLRTAAQNYEASPDNIFMDEIKTTVYDSPRYISNRQLFKQLDEVSLEDVKKVYDAEFGDASGFTFFFAGNIPDTAAFESLVARYISSLGCDKSDESERDVLRVSSGDKEERVKLGQDSKCRVFISYTGTNIGFNAKNEATLSLLSNVLSERYLKKIREEMGATYGVRVQASLSPAPTEDAMLMMYYYTNAEQLEETIKEIDKALQDIAANGVTADEIDGFKKSKVNDIKNFIATNNGLFIELIDVNLYGKDRVATTEQQIISEITPADIQKMASNIVETFSRRAFITTPQE